jgi:hypothetical protein
MTDLVAVNSDGAGEIEVSTDPGAATAVEAPLVPRD